MAKKRGIQDLIGTAKWHRSTPMSKRYSPEVWAKVVADLKELIATEREGKPIPSTPRVATYLAEEYGVEMSPFSVGRYLDKARNNLPIE